MAWLLKLSLLLRQLFLLLVWAPDSCPQRRQPPKEMLPVVDRPAIQYVVEEAIRAGLNDVLMITGRNKRALEDHFDRVPVLEQQLAEQGKDALLASVVETNELGGDLHYVRQGDPKGLGHAVLRAKRPRRR